MVRFIYIVHCCFEENWRFHDFELLITETKYLSGLPDFSWYNKPKREIFTKMAAKVPMALKWQIGKYQMAMKYIKSLCTSQGISEDSKIGLFGTKIYHLATLISFRTFRP
jgi:hypothetical protein